MANINRRRFLSAGAGLGMLGGSGVLGLLSQKRAFAADTSGYKALVCIFMKGGLDHADLVLPYDQSSLALLRSQRENLHAIYDGTELARTRDSLLPLTLGNADAFGGREFALPPEMSEARTLFESNELAIIGDVGALIEPTNRASMDAGNVVLPARLFSHNDQQSTWMSFGVEGVREGWGGKFASAAHASDPNSAAVFMALTASSPDVFLASEDIGAYALTSSGAQSINLVANRGLLGRSDGHDSARTKLNAHLRAEGLSSENLFMRDILNIGSNALDNAEVLNLALEQLQPLTTVFPNTSFGRQLRVVAETIAIQQALNVSRQVFYVTIGGFDTHSSQATRLPGLLTQLSQGMALFKSALTEINMWNNVTTFTMSDFGRTVIDNGDGTDHGWGSHQLAMGGAVSGGQIYGDVTDHDVDSDRYTETRGRLIPTTSVEQYAATLGRWFGLDAGELNAALPNLRNFNSDNLGFMS